ncbi:MAG: helix-turn-helix domain-containing protein [Candidatus Eremiobacteraeota bacterium]|nr:helix-turn-helix domain-containing protein [Candidatus Eremiobacteraeota bacterium]MBV8654495.1 helix-turn-helix domain-containing protein [Candidatus Eremiobacteraeota bacterium]
MPALGERFRAAREARGLTLSDVSEQIRIRSVYLAAIEEENWTAIGAPVYVRGFLRTYARFLGLDPEEVVSAFSTGPQPAGVPAAGERTPARSSSASAERGAEPVGGVSLVLWGAAIVAILLIAFVVYNEVTMRQAGTVPIASVTEVPSVLPSNSGSPGADESALPSPAPGEDGAKSLALVLSAPSWLRVTVDGSVSMEGTFPAGTAKTFHGKNALVRIGNAGGVEIYVDGKDVGKLGKPGDVVEHAFTL